MTNIVEKQIISQQCLEQVGRISVRKLPNQSLRSIRIAIHASLSYGNNWFLVNEVTAKLPGISKELVGSKKCAEQLAEFGIAEMRTLGTAGSFRYQARLTCELCPVGHFHGLHTKRISEAIDHYCLSHPCAAPAVMLLLIAIHVYGMRGTVELAKFLEPEFNVTSNPCLTTKLLRNLEKVGIVTLIRKKMGTGRPYLVFPVTQ